MFATAKVSPALSIKSSRQKNICENISRNVKKNNANDSSSSHVKSFSILNVPMPKSHH